MSEVRVITVDKLREEMLSRAVSLLALNFAAESCEFSGLPESWQVGDFQIFLLGAQRFRRWPRN